MSNYIVTGGVGFIGKHLCEALLKDGHYVLSVDNCKNGEYSHKNAGELRRYSNFRQLNVSVSNLEEIADEGRLFDGIFHLAAIPRVAYSIEHPLETTDNNISGTVAVLEYAKKRGINKVVFASSSSVYGDNDVPFIETQPVEPMSPYAIHKLTGEYFMKFYNDFRGVNATSLRFFNVYGPNQDETHPYALLIAKAISCVKNNNSVPVFGDGTNKRDFTYVDDVVSACIKAMNTPEANGEVFNVGAGKPYSVLEIMDIIAENVGHPVAWEQLPARIEPPITYANNEKAQRILGWSPKTDIYTGVKNCYDDMMR